MAKFVILLAGYLAGRHQAHPLFRYTVDKDMGHDVFIIIHHFEAVNIAGSSTTYVLPYSIVDNHPLAYYRKRVIAERRDSFHSD
jgi:hypothetical protein